MSNQSEDPLCVSCWARKSVHVASGGSLECPPLKRYFTPCLHKSSHGWGSVSSDGRSDGESWCDVCGKQLAFRRIAA